MTLSLEERKFMPCTISILSKTKLINNRYSYYLLFVVLWLNFPSIMLE